MYVASRTFLGCFGKECADFALVQKVFLQKLKNSELIALAEEISGQLNIVCVIWLLVAIIDIKIDNEN